VTEAAYNRFKNEHGLTLPRATFIGLCAYLYHLIQWQYHIPAAAFDEFICSHPTFLSKAKVIETDRTSTIAYHHWFAANKIHCCRPGNILAGGLLYDIGAENPYTFALTESSMELMATKASVDSTLPHATLPRDHRESRETSTVSKDALHAPKSDDPNMDGSNVTSHEAHVATEDAIPNVSNPAEERSDSFQTERGYPSSVSSASSEGDTQQPSFLLQSSAVSPAHDLQEDRCLGHEASPTIAGPGQHEDGQRVPPQIRSTLARNILSVPTYRALRSNEGLNKIKAIGWMLEPGKRQFDARQDALLAPFGVTAEHTGTCILVPKGWYGLNPLDLMNGFTSEKCPRGDNRLPFFMFDHRTLWARAASWFDSKYWPRTGAQFDNFINLGSYKPKDGSHLCHHPTCINQHHLRYEDSDINSNRQQSAGPRIPLSAVPKCCPDYGGPTACIIVLQVALL
jgi:hypothetical protein